MAEILLKLALRPINQSFVYHQDFTEIVPSLNMNIFNHETNE